MLKFKHGKTLDLFPHDKRLMCFSFFFFFLLRGYTNNRDCKNESMQPSPLKTKCRNFTHACIKLACLCLLAPFWLFPLPHPQINLHQKWASAVCYVSECPSPIMTLSSCGKRATLSAAQVKLQKCCCFVHLFFTVHLPLVTKQFFSYSQKAKEQKTSLLVKKFIPVFQRRMKI